MEIRKGHIDDADDINTIYNHYILHSPATFDLKVWDRQRRIKWIEEFSDSNGLYHLIVCENNNRVIGFACNRKLKEKPAYITSTETTVYVIAKCAIKGVGSALYRELFTFMDNTRLHRAYAGIALPNEKSIALHKKFDFVHIGTYSEVGFKFGKYHCVAWYEKKIFC